jgi:hypothetical protein
MTTTPNPTPRRRLDTHTSARTRQQLDAIMSALELKSIADVIERVTDEYYQRHKSEIEKEKTG